MQYELTKRDKIKYGKTIVLTFFCFLCFQNKYLNLFDSVKEPNSAHVMTKKCFSFKFCFY